MANTAIQLKKSGITGNTPVDLQHGEVAINYADGKLYYKNDADQIKYITNQDTFGTISANGQLILATTPLDVLTILPDHGVTIESDTVYKNIFIGVNEGSLSVYTHANSAYDKANIAWTHANAAFTKANTSSGVTYTYSSSAPVDPKLGDLWYDTTDNIKYEWSTDGTSYFWWDTESTAISSSNSSSSIPNAPIILNGQTIYLGNTANISSIWNTSYNNENMVVPNIDDPYWAWGANSSGGKVWLQGKFWGNDVDHGIRFLNSIDGSVPFSVDGTGNVNAPSLVTSTITFNDGSVQTTAGGNPFELSNSGFHLTLNSDGTLNIPVSIVFDDGTTQSTAYTPTSYDTANSASLYANSAYTQANTATSNAAGASQYANSAYNQANTSISDAAGASLYANSAYTQSNTATLYALSAGSYANSAYVQANSAYSLASSKLDQTGGTISGSLNIQHDLTVLGNVTYTGSVTSVTISGNTGQFFGYTANGFNAFYAGIPTGYATMPNEVVQFTGANNSYIQVNFQNESGGPGATTDWIATANNGTNYSYYVDMGIAGSGYVNTSPDNSLGTSLMPNDSYLYAQGDYDNPSNPGGNLVIGAASTGKNVRILAGGVNDANVVVDVRPTQVKIHQPLVFQDETTQTTAAISAADSQVIFNQANTATSDAQSAGLYANGAFVQANTATNNASGASQYANSAYAQANTATLDSVSAGNYANSAYTKANSAWILANTAYFLADRNLTDTAWAMLQANSAFTHANAAYTKANTGGGADDVARTTANAAFNKANTANVTYTVSATSPGGAKLGDLWFNTTDNLKYEYATDGTNYFWWDTESIKYTGASYIASATAPAAPNLGDMWYNTVDNITYIFSSDGTNTFWWDTQSSSTVSTTYIPITKRDTTTASISISNGYISITNRGGATVNVATY